MFAVAFVVVLALLLYRAYRAGPGSHYWIEATGWATIALLVASAWLVPWYAIWFLPLAALSGEPAAAGRLAGAVRLDARDRGAALSALAERTTDLGLSSSRGRRVRAHRAHQARSPSVRGRRVLRGAGDDAAVTRADGLIVTSVDAFVEGVHFRLATTSLGDLGHKCLAASLSDLAAMGAERRRGLSSRSACRRTSASARCSS